MKVAPQYEAGKEVVAGSGCLACHKLGENGNNGPGPELTHIAAADPARRDRPLGGDRPRYHALLPRPAAEEAQRARRFPLLTRLSPLRDSAQFAGQVNRMFDRVAGRYDLLNSVMTRGPAPSLARAGRRSGRARPRRLGARRLLRHRRPGARAGRPGRAGRPRRRLRLLRADARPGPGEGARASGAAASASSGPMRCSLPYDAGRFDAVTVGFGVRNFADLDAGLREMARVLRPGGRLVVLEITQPTPPAFLDLLLALVRPHRAGARHALRRSGGLLLPARVGAQLPRPRAAWPRRWTRPASSGSAGRSSPAGSSRSTAASRQGDPPLRRPAAGHRGPRRLEPLAAGAAGRGRGAAARAGRRPRRAARPRDAATTLAAGGKRLRPLLVLLCAGADGGEEAVRAAAAIELVHMATLVHDDVLDAAPLRRGQPTVAATSGRDRADGGRRPALLARLRPARRARETCARSRCSRRLGRACPRRAGPAPRRLRHRRSPSSATWSAAG